MRRLLPILLLSLLPLTAVAVLPPENPPAAVPGQAGDATPPTSPVPPVPTPAPPSAPASDREETGALTDLLPDRVETLPLPQEDPAEALLPVEARVESGGLFPDDLWPAPPGPGGPDLPAPAPPSPALEGPLPAAVAATCFGAAPPPPFHDPGNLLPPSQARALRGFLSRSVTERGGFPVNVIVFPPAWQLPGDLNPGDLLQRWHGDTPALLAICFAGHPDRTQAFFSPAALRAWGGEPARAAGLSMNEASRLTSPSAQIERFCYRMAIRLDHLHREVGSLPGNTTPVPGPLRGWWMLFFLLPAALPVWRWARRFPFRKGKPVLLPDREMVCRLGGPHSGGNGAMMPLGLTAPRR